LVSCDRSAATSAPKARRYQLCACRHSVDLVSEGPHPMTPSEIASGLTKAQRRGIAEANGRSVRLSDDDLDDLHYRGITGHKGWVDELTDLGESVRRSILESRQQ